MANFEESWSTTAASNTSVAGVSIAENCAAANLNDAIRGAMSDLAKWRDATSGAKTTTGSANAYVLSTGMSIAALAAGLVVAAKLNFSASGAATLAVDGLTATAIKNLDGTAIASGDMPSGSICVFAHDGTNWQLRNRMVSSSTFQAQDADLTALAALDATAGMLARTGADTFAVRTLAVTGPASIANATGAAAAPTITVILNSEPQGRLTLTTATPIQTAENATAATVYYTPYKGLYVPLWDGTNTLMTSFAAELSIALDSNSGHTGYQQSGKNFDLFIYSDAGTIRLVTGPAWASDTARATALEYKNGFLCNAASMTGRFGTANGNTVTVGQDFGLCVGTMRGSADGQTAWVANPAAAAGGGACKLFLWNAYNRRPASAASKDSTDTWTYATATWRSANNNTANRITAVFGLNEDAVSVVHNAWATHSNSAAIVGVGLDVTSAYTGTPGGGTSASTPSLSLSMSGRYDGLPGTGAHFFQAVEYGTSGTTTFHGDNATPLNEQMALIFQGWM